MQNKTYSLADITKLKKQIAKLESELVVANKNIDKLSNVEKKYISERKLFNAFSEASFEAIFLSENGICTRQNITAEKMFGYTLEEAIGKPGIEWIIAEDRLIVENNILSEYEKPYKVTGLRKDGSTFPAEIRAKNNTTYLEKKVRVTTLSDISDRMFIEEELKESEKKYRTIIERSNDMIWSLDHVGNIIFFNNKVEKITGLKFSEYEGKSFIHIILEEDIPILMDIFTRTMKGEAIDYELRVSSPFGLVTIATHTAPIYDENEEITGVISFGKDITKSKEVEEMLKKSHNKYQDLFEKSKDAILIIQDGTFVDCNKAAVEMLKYKEKSELLLTHPSDLSPEKQPDGRYSKEKSEEMMNIAVEKGSHRFEWNHVRANKENFPVEVLLTSITNEDGSQTLHTTWRDISNRKKDEKLQKALYDITEEANKDSSVSEYYKSLHGIIKELMPANNFYLAIHNSETNIIRFPYHVDERDAHPKPKLLGKGLTEYVLKTKKSQIITAEKDKILQERNAVELSGEFTKIWVGIYLKFEGKYKGVLVIQDYENENAYDNESLKILKFVSEQIVKVLDKRYADASLREMVEKLFEAKEQLELINKNKDRFFSIISHDLRSPFMALMGISQMISEDMDSMSVGEVKEMTGAIYHSTQNLNKLIENLLSWSRLQMGTFIISPKEIDMKEVSKNVVNVLQLSAKEKNITIEDNIAETNVFADEDCTNTILRNLINNAIKFTERGGKIKLSSKPAKDLIEITVKDNGIGIRKEVLEKIFSITEKISEAGTEKEVGTGLGLILCKELVEKNGGEIRVKSELGKGCKFVFSLPRKEKS
ncbi:MAG: PAS domain-containing sensor histidine kinase [Melioribacteraceae bacterium]|jgi:PAS domain S-box-containing protein|nr:PAS domain-containing sensor histidine kinase [Melioribacteraceae bacterium]